MKSSITLWVTGAIFVLIGLVASQNVVAQLDAVWDGTTGNWSDASKWSTVNYPDNGNGGFDYNALVAGGNVTVDLNPTIEALFLSGGNLYFNSTTLTANDLFTWSGGRLDGGVTNADGGLVLSGGGKYLNNGHVLNYDGVVNWTGGDIYVDNGTVLNNVSTATLDTNLDGGSIYTSSDGVFNNEGTFTKSGGAGVTWIWNTEFNSSGVVNVDSGTLYLFAFGTMTGPFNIAAGTTLTFSIGPYDFETGSSITGDGNVVLSGATNFNDGLFDIGGKTSFSSGTNNFFVDFNTQQLDVSGGNHYFNSSTLTANDLFTWSGGRLDGGVTNADGGLVLAGGTKYLDNGHVLNYDGVVNWTGGDIYVNNGTVLNNVSTATLDTNFDNGSIYTNQGIGVFNNEGTFTKSGGEGITWIWNTEFNNSGVVNVDSGTLSLYTGEGTMTGPFNIAAGTTLEIYGGTYDFDTGSSITGDGDLELNGTTNFNDGLFDVGGITSFSGTNNFFVDFNTQQLDVSGGNHYFNSSTLTANDLFTWSGGRLDGGVTNADGGLVLAGGTKYLDNGHVLNYDGVVNWTGGDIYVNNGTVLNNVSTATLDTNFDNGSIYTNQGIGVFNNEGTFTKSGGEGITWIWNTEFNNSGVVNVDSGTLSLYTGEGTMTGPFNIAAGTTLEIYGGTYDFDTGSSITGDGNVVVSGSSLILTGGAISPGSSIGTLSFNGITKIVDGSALEIDLKATSGTPGTDWDFIDVTGTLDFDDDTLPSGITVKLTSLDANGLPGLLNGFDQGLDYTWPIANASTFEGFSSSFVDIDASEFQNSFCGIFTVTVEGNQLLLNYLSQIVTVNADELTVLRGFHVGGTLEDTYFSDDVYLQYIPGITLSSSEPPVWLVFEGTLCSDMPPSLGFTLEASANTVGLGQTVEMFNYSAGVYELVDSRAASIADSVLYFEADGDVTRFVEFGTGKVRSRFAWKANGPITLYPWTVRIDQVLWTLNPK